MKGLSLISSSVSSFIFRNHEKAKGPIPKSSPILQSGHFKINDRLELIFSLSD
jgi:hypothetical protein